MTLIFNNSVKTWSIIRNIGQSQTLLYKAMEKLASGHRINSAADDPAGLVISEQMRSRIASLNQEIENTSFMINKYRTASSYSLQMRGYLTELKSLTIAASNTGLVDENMARAYQDEANRLIETYNKTIKNARFGNQNLFDGSPGSITSIAPIASIDLTDPINIDEAVKNIDENIMSLDSAISDIGATQKNDLEVRQASLRIELENLTAAESQIRDTDYLKEITNFILGEFQMKASIAMLAHSYMTSHTVLGLLDRD